MPQEQKPLPEVYFLVEDSVEYREDPFYGSLSFFTLSLSKDSLMGLASEIRYMALRDRSSPAIVTLMSLQCGHYSIRKGPDPEPAPVGAMELQLTPELKAALDATLKPE